MIKAVDTRLKQWELREDSNLVNLYKNRNKFRYHVLGSFKDRQGKTLLALYNKNCGSSVVNGIIMNPTKERILVLYK